MSIKSYIKRLHLRFFKKIKNRFFDKFANFFGVKRSTKGFYQIFGFRIAFFLFSPFLRLFDRIPTPSCFIVRIFPFLGKIILSVFNLIADQAQKEPVKAPEAFVKRLHFLKTFSKNH